LASNKFQPDVTTFSHIVDTCCRSGKVDLACCWLTEMEYHGFEPNQALYNCILQACSVQGDVHAAVRCWTKLISKVQSPSTTSYNHMAGAFLQVGDPRAALQWIVRMLKAGKKPDSVTQAMLQDECPEHCTTALGPSIGASIHKLLEDGDFDEVQICIEMVQSLGFSPSEELIESIISECLSTPSSSVPSRCSTQTSNSSDLASKEEMTIMSTSLELAPVGKLMQSTLPNIQVSWHADKITVLF